MPLGGSRGLHFMNKFNCKTCFFFSFLLVLLAYAIGLTLLTGPARAFVETKTIYQNSAFIEESSNDVLDINSHQNEKYKYYWFPSLNNSRIKLPPFVKSISFDGVIKKASLIDLNDLKEAGWLSRKDKNYLTSLNRGKTMEVKIVLANDKNYVSWLPVKLYFSPLVGNSPEQQLRIKLSYADGSIGNIVYIKNRNPDSSNFLNLKIKSPPTNQDGELIIEFRTKRRYQATLSGILWEYEDEAIDSNVQDDSAILDLENIDEEINDFTEPPVTIFTAQPVSISSSMSTNIVSVSPQTIGNGNSQIVTGITVNIGINTKKNDNNKSNDSNIILPTPIPITTTSPSPAISLSPAISPSPTTSPSPATSLSPAISPSLATISTPIISPTPSVKVSPHSNENKDKSEGKQAENNKDDNNKSENHDDNKDDNDRSENHDDNKDDNDKLENHNEDKDDRDKSENKQTEDKEDKDKSKDQTDNLVSEPAPVVSEPINVQPQENDSSVVSVSPIDGGESTNNNIENQNNNNISPQEISPPATKQEQNTDKQKDSNPFPFPMDIFNQHLKPKF